MNYLTKLQVYPARGLQAYEAPFSLSLFQNYKQKIKKIKNISSDYSFITMQVTLID